MNKAFLILAVITVSCTAQVDYFSVRGLLGPSDKNAINQWVSTYRNDKSIVSNSITQASQAAANTKNEIFGKYSSKVQQAFTETQDIGQKALSGQNDANSVESQLTRTYSRLSNNDRRSFNELFSRVYGYDLGSIINTGMSSNGRGRRPGVVGFLPLLLGAGNRGRTNNYYSNNYYPPNTQTRPISTPQRPPIVPIPSQTRTFADASTQTGNNIGSGSSPSTLRTNSPSSTTITKPKTVSAATQTSSSPSKTKSSSTVSKTKTTSTGKKG